MNFEKNLSKSAKEGKLKQCPERTFTLPDFCRFWQTDLQPVKIAALIARRRRASYICLSSFFNPSPKWKVEVVTQETNPVYLAYTHYCLTLEPWTVIFFNFIFISFELENCSSKKIGLYSTNWFWNDLN